MYDLTIELANRPGALAAMAAALGEAGISIEGGGVWAVGTHASAHFLFADGSAARRVLEAAGIRVLAEREALVLRLRQDVPGQLGLLARQFADAGVNLAAMYSDHAQQTILIVDDLARGQAVAQAWMRSRT